MALVRLTPIPESFQMVYSEQLVAQVCPNVTLTIWRLFEAVFLDVSRLKTAYGSFAGITVATLRLMSALRD